MEPPEARPSRLPVVGIYHRTPEPYLPLVRELVPESHLRVCTAPDALGGILPELDVLLAFKFGFRPFPRDEIVQAPRLRWVQLASAGIDHMVPYNPRRLTVTNASGIHGAIMAEYVIGMLVHMRWNVARLVEQQKARHWERYAVPSLAGRTLGVVGTGQVGVAIASRARAFGMRTLGVRRSGAPLEEFEEIFGPGGLHRLFAESDVVVLALPLTNETRHVIGARELQALRPSAYLINVSRGGIVDEAALIELLRERRIAGAILDVFEEEPLPSSSPFWTLPNVVVTPHISSELDGWQVELARIFCRNLRHWMNHELLENVVDPAAGY
jgi:phosphoglycerate dehydrogenase-like enzyme